MVDSRFEDLNGQLEQPFGFVGPTFAIVEQRAIMKSSKYLDTYTYELGIQIDLQMKYKLC